MTILDSFLLLAAALELTAIGAGVVARGRAARAIGEPVVAERPPRPRLHLALVAVALLAVVLLDPRPLPIAVAVLGVVLLVVVPDHRERVLGRDGVQRGWRARRFDEVEEWRLTGDHLRVLFAGEWEAVPAPAADHAALRTVLEERAPGRESRFTD